jgi:hypothetical protein
MKTIKLTMLQAIRLAIMLDNHQGQRKDLRSLQDMRERLGITDEDMLTYTKPVANGLIISDDVKAMPPIEFGIVREEARKLLEVLDQQTLTVRDLVWAEPLAKELAIVVENKNG